MFKKFGLLIVVIVLLAVVSPAQAANGCTVMIAGEPYNPGVIEISGEGGWIEVKDCESIRLTQGQGWAQSSGDYRTAVDGVIYLYFTTPLEEKAYLTDNAGHVWEIQWVSGEQPVDQTEVQSDSGSSWYPWIFVLTFLLLFVLAVNILIWFRDRQAKANEPKISIRLFYGSELKGEMTFKKLFGKNVTEQLRHAAGIWDSSLGTRVQKVVVNGVDYGRNTCRADAVVAPATIDVYIV